MELDAWTKTPEEVVNYYKSDETTGLSDDQIKRNLDKFGYNGKCWGFRG